MTTKMTIDADAILNRAKPLLHQEALEIQPYGHLVRLPIALAESACRHGLLERRSDGSFILTTDPVQDEIEVSRIERAPRRRLGIHRQGFASRLMPRPPSGRGPHGRSDPPAAA